MKINHKKIEFFFQDVLNKLKVKKNDRKLLIQSLVGSSLRGVDSHGIRLFSHYVHCLEEGRINKNPRMKVIKKKKGIAVYDADDGLGHVAALKASKIVTSMAKQNEIAAIGIVSSSHIGAAGVYSLEIAQQNCIGLSFTHSDSFAILFNGKLLFMLQIHIHLLPLLKQIIICTLIFLQLLFRGTKLCEQDQIKLH